MKDNNGKILMDKKRLGSSPPRPSEEKEDNENILYE